MAQNTTTFDLAPLNRILGEFGSQKGAVIPQPRSKGVHAIALA